MKTSMRNLFLVAIAVMIASTGIVSAAEPDGGKQSDLIAVTGTLDSIECVRCVHWKGTGGAERVGHKLIVTATTPAQFAGKQLKMLVRVDGEDTSQPWKTGSQLSFSVPEEELLRQHVIVRRSSLLLTSN
jgi:hypothetical protein